MINRICRAWCRIAHTKHHTTHSNPIWCRLCLAEHPNVLAVQRPEISHEEALELAAALLASDKFREEMGL